MTHLAVRMLGSSVTSQKNGLHDLQSGSTMFVECFRGNPRIQEECQAASRYAPTKKRRMQYPFLGRVGKQKEESPCSSLLRHRAAWNHQRMPFQWTLGAQMGTVVAACVAGFFPNMAQKLVDSELAFECRGRKHNSDCNYLCLLLSRRVALELWSGSMKFIEWCFRGNPARSSHAFKKNEVKQQDGTTDSGAHGPEQDLSSFPRFVDHDGETIRDTSSDGMSYAGTVVRGGVGHSATSTPCQATSEQLPMNYQ